MLFTALTYYHLSSAYDIFHYSAESRCQNIRAENLNFSHRANSQFAGILYTLE